MFHSSFNLFCLCNSSAVYINCYGVVVGNTKSIEANQHTKFLSQCNLVESCWMDRRTQLVHLEHNSDQWRVVAIVLLVVLSGNVWVHGLCAHRVPEPKSTTQTCSGKLYSIYVLSMLLLTYLVNQLDRFLLSIVTKPMSQDLDYGDWACMRNSSMIENSVVCNATTKQEYVCIFS